MPGLCQVTAFNVFSWTIGFPAGRESQMRLSLIARVVLGLALTSASSRLAAQSAGQKAGWRATGSVGFVGGGAGGWDDEYSYSTGLAVAIEASAIRALRPGLTFNASALTFYSYAELGIECVWTCEQDVHVLSVFGTVRQKVPTSSSGWGIVGELGAGGVQLRNARRRPGTEMIAADGPALLGGLELRTRAFWRLVPSGQYREFIILQPDASTLRFRSVTLKIGTR
jgi:hypothetical protein